MREEDGSFEWNLEKSCRPREGVGIHFMCSRKLRKVFLKGVTLIYVFE